MYKSRYWFLVFLAIFLLLGRVLPQVLMAQESEAKESFEQLEMLQRTHDKLRSRADRLEAVHDGLFNKLEVVKKTLLVSGRQL